METIVTQPSGNITPPKIAPHAITKPSAKKTRVLKRKKTASQLELNNKILAAWNNALAHDSSQNLPSSYNIINSIIPNYLRPSLSNAQELESHLFINSPKLFGLNSDQPLKLEPEGPNDPVVHHLSKFVNYSDASMDLAFSDLILFGKSSDDFFYVLNNYGKGALLNVIEHMLHEPNRIYRMQYRFNTCDQMKEQVLLAMLSANVNEKRIRKIFKSGVYKYNRLVKISGRDTNKNGNYRSDPIGWRKMTLNNNKCRFASLIISLYCMCMRVMFNVNIKRFRPIEVENLPHSVSYVIATACYLCVREVYNAMYFKYWSKSFFLEFFPHIEDIFELLELLLHDQVYVVYCSRCSAPFFVEREKKLKLNICINNDDHCPNCHSKAYFKVSDIEY